MEACRQDFTCRHVFYKSFGYAIVEVLNVLKSHVVRHDAQFLLLLGGGGT